MDIILRIVDTLRTSFKYTYLTDKEFAKCVDFPYTEEIDNDGKSYFLLEEKDITILTLQQAKELMQFVKPQFYLPKTTAYIENDNLHVVIDHRHVVFPMSFSLRYTDTPVAFYPDYSIPLSEAEANLIVKLLRLI